MGVSLRTKTEYGQGLALEHVEIGILVEYIFAGIILMRWMFCFAY